MESILRDFLSKNASGGAHGSHYVYWVPIKSFHQLPICRWKHNRPPDVDRVAEIHAFIQTSKRVDGMIYLACVNHQLVCYESNHRREALKDIAEVADILVDVMWSVTDEDVKQEFLRLNKAISVPELYIVDTPISVDVSRLREIVDGFCKNYSTMKSSSNHPQRPNFTRDMLMDEFYRAITELHISADVLIERLTELNRSMSLRDRKRLSDRVIAKCEASGLWLFAWSNRLSLPDLR
jgi:hypothetical protein